MALLFDNVDDKIVLSGRVSTATQNYTMHAWIKGNFSQQTGMIFNNGDDAGGYAMVAGAISDGSGSKLVGLMGSIAWIDASTSLTDDTWHSVAMERTATTTNFYVDGVKVTTTVTNTPNSPVDIAVIGAQRNSDGTTYSRFFDGVIAEVSFWNGTLNAAQHTDLANGKSADQVGSPVFYMKLEDKSGDVEIGSQTATFTGTTVATHPTIDYGDTTTTQTITGTANITGGAGFANGYGYRRKITIDETKVAGASDLTDFTIPVTGTYSYLKTTGNGGKVENANGYDIIFETSGGTALKFERTRYNASTGEVIFWVKIPTLDYNDDTEIYMYYGKSGVSDTEDVANAYDSSWEMNNHLEEDTSTTGGIKDSIDSKHDLTPWTSDGTTGNLHTTSGIIGDAQDFDGSSNSLYEDGDASRHTDGSFTIEGWMNLDTLGTSHSMVIFNCKHTASPWRMWYIEKGANDKVSFVRVNDSETFESANGSTTLSTGTWYYVVGVFDDSTGNAYVYLDGSQDGTGSMTDDMYNGAGQIRVGLDWSGGGQLDGVVDEVAFHKTARSASWVETRYNAISSPSTFYSVGSEEISGDATTTKTIDGIARVEKDGVLTVEGVANITDGSLEDNDFDPIYGSYSVRPLDSANAKVAIRFKAPQDTIFDKVYLSVNDVVGTSPNYKVSVQGEASSEPDGTEIESATLQFSEGWQEVVLSDSVSLTSGSFYYIVIEYVSGTIDATNKAVLNAWSGNESFYPRNKVEGGLDLYYSTDGSTWLKPSDTPVFATSSDIGQPYAGRTLGRVYENRHRGLNLRLPNNTTITGFSFRIKKGGTPPEDCLYKVIRKSDNVTLASGTLATESEVTTAFEWYDATLSSSLTLLADTDYRIVIHQDGSGSTSNYYDVEAYNSVGTGTDIGYRHHYNREFSNFALSNDGTSWTDTFQNYDTVFQLDRGTISTQTLDGKARIKKVQTETVDGIARVTAQPTEDIDGTARIKAIGLTNFIDINGSFEDNITGWTAYIFQGTTPTLSHDSTESLEGSHSFKHVGIGVSSWTGVKRVLSGLKVGTRYRIGAFTKGTQGDTMNLYVNAAGNPQTFGYVQTGEWMFIYLDFTASATSHNSYFRTTTDAATFYLDEAFIAEIGGNLEGQARIQTENTETLDARARIEKEVLQTITGVASIIVGVLSEQTITGVANILAETQKTADGVARIEKTESSDIDGIARVEHIKSDDVDGKARIESTLSEDVTGTGSIAKDTVRNVDGVARVSQTESESVDGTARVARTEGEDITGVSRVTTTESSDIDGKARVEKPSTQDISGTAKLNIQRNQTVDGTGRVSKTESDSIDGTARVIQTYKEDIDGTANILLKRDQEIGGSYRIAGEVEFRIDNNLIVDSDRAAWIGDIADALADISYHPFKANTGGLGYFQPADKLRLKDTTGAAYEVFVFRSEISMTGGMREVISAEMPEQTQTDHDYAGVIGQAIKNTQIIVDKQEGVIQSLNTNLEDNYLESSEVTQLTDSISSSVAALTGSVDGLAGDLDNQGDELDDVQGDISTLEQRADSLELGIQGIGGTNLLKNSVGLKGGIEEWQELGEDGLPTDADNSATVDSSTDVATNSESGSALRIDEQFILQTLSTLANEVHTMYFRYKANADFNIEITGEPTYVVPSSTEWAVVKYQFTPSTDSTTVKIDNTASGVSSYAIITDAVVKAGDTNGWIQAPNEVYGQNFRFDKDGFTIESLTDAFKSVLDNEKLVILNTEGGTDKIVALFSKDSGKITDLTVQDLLTLQRYENSDASARFIATDTGFMLVINDS